MILVLALLGLLLVLYRWRRAGGRLPPGPRGLPVLGYLPWIDAAAPHETLTTLARRYGRVYSLRLGNVLTVVLTDAKMIREALSRDEFVGRAPLYLTHGIMQGYGLICAEGSLWKEQRKFVSASLKNFGMVKFGARRGKMEARIGVGVGHLLERLDAVGGDACDLLPALQHCIGNVVNDLVFGRTWDEHDSTWTWLQHLQEEGTKMIGVAGPLNFLPWLRFVPGYRRTIEFLLDGKLQTHRVYEDIIAEHQGDASRDQDNVLASFSREMRRRGDDVGHYTQAQFHHLLADLFGAGLDTTLSTLRWYFLLLAANPDAQVQAELDGVLERRAPTLDDVAALPYTEASLAEAQRMRSVTPLGIPHGTVKDAELHGFLIPKGTMIIPLQWALHMDPDLWHEPQKFNPERFLDVNGRFFKPDFFIPFQTGARMCVGEELAHMMLFLFGACVLQRFTLALEDDVIVDLRGECGITLTPAQHKIRVVPRS